MIDVCFNLSAQGNLNMIRKVIKSKKIIVLELKLHYGDINCDVEGLIKRNFEYDKRQLYNWYKDEKIVEEALKKETEWFEKLSDHLQKLNTYLESGEEITLWISNCAQDRCALYWLCKYTENYSNKIYTVLCPEYCYDKNDKYLIESHNWADYSENLYYMAEFAGKEVLLTDDERKFYAKQWDKISNENAPLRILFSNKIVGVGEDFFDDEILSCIIDTPRSQGEIIGRFLAKWIGGDMPIDLICERIEHFVEKGIIKIVEDKYDERNGCWSRTIVR